VNDVLGRAVRIVLWPKDEWPRIKEEAPDSVGVLTRFVLPLACIPAVSWSIGLAVFGGRGVVAGDKPSLDFGEVVHGSVITLLGAVASVLLVAAFIWVLAPFFAGRRDWSRALQVASYSSSPVLLAGVLLLLPDLVFALMIAAVHSFYLQYLGVQYILGAKAGESAEFVALVVMLVLMASTLLGALGSSVGVM
jgi:hypothetical protein